MALDPVTTIDVDISGLGLRFEGLTPTLGAALAQEWKSYVRDRVAPALVIRVENEDRTMKPGRFMVGGMEIIASAERVQFELDEGRVVHDAHEAHAVAHLAQGDEGRRFWGLVNLSCAAVGWRLLARRGGAVHAAGVLIDDEAYLLIGPSGCGKTTWSKTAAGAGLPVLSDDCVLVDGIEGRLMALGSPFRSKEFPSPGPGRWPVAAILLPAHADAPSVAPLSRLMLEARLAANLLFSPQAAGVDTIAAQAVSAIASGAPARTLSFRPDASWIPIVRDLSSGR
jgi:hypothetical protein